MAVPGKGLLINRRAFLVAAAGITSATRSAYADSVDQAVINCKLIVLSVVTSSSSSELGSMVDDREVRVALQEFLAASFADEGLQILVQDRATADVPRLLTLYVTIRIDLGIVPTDGDAGSIVGAVGTFFKKEGMSAHNSGHPLTFFTSAKNDNEIRQRVIDAARLQLKGAVIHPIVHWAK